MTEEIKAAARRAASLRLSDAQLAWLTESGIDRRLLSQWVPRSNQDDVPRRRAAHSSHATPADAKAAIAEVRARLVPPRKAASTGVSPGKATEGDHAPISAQSLEHIAPAANHGPAAGSHAWTGLQARAQDCEACGLRSERDQLVWGEGEQEAPGWLIVGEAPSRSDDSTGRPFQGEAGRLLHAMLVAIGVYPASVSLGGGDVLTPPWAQEVTAYFTNIVKCRPLGNRSPAASEIASCQPFLRQQIELLRPVRILALGRLASQTLLQVSTDLEALRGRVHYFDCSDGQRIPVVPTWHPATLLHHPQNKAQAWADLNLAKDLTG